MQTLLGWLTEYLLGGVPSNFVHDAAKGAWQKITARSWEDLYLDSFQQAVQESKVQLQKYSVENGEINLSREVLQRVLRQHLGVAIHVEPFSALSNETFIRELAIALSEHSVLEINGNNLSVDDYTQIIRNLIQHVMRRFKDAILSDEAAFRRVLLDEIGANNDGIRQIQIYLNERFDLGLQQLAHVRADVTDIKHSISKMMQPVLRPHRAAVQNMVEHYGAIFGGREHEIAMLDRFLEQDDVRYALLLAPTGRGKTALLIHWLASIERMGQWNIVFAPISRRFQTASAEVTLGILAHALADFYGEPLGGYNTSPDQLRALIADYLRREPPSDRRLLVVLDGLDEAIGWSVGPDLFPLTPSSKVRIIAAARSMAQKARANWIVELGWPEQSTYDVPIGLLAREAVADILRQMGNPLASFETNVDLLAEIERVSQGDPLTIKFLIEGLFDGTLTPARLTSLPPGLEAYLKDWLDELRQHSADGDRVYVLLGLCAIALGPLTSADIQKLAPDTFARLATLQIAAASVARFLIGDGRSESGYVFSHPRLRELYVENILSPQERSDFQQQFVDYGWRWYQAQIDPLPEYLRLFWISHLIEARAWDKAQQVLTEIVPTDVGHQQPWAVQRLAAEGGYTGYLTDLDRLWYWAEGQNRLALAFRCALITSSIYSLTSNFSPALLVGLVAVGTPEGRWPAVAALEHIRHMRVSEHQRAALQALVENNIELPWAQAVEIAQEMKNKEVAAKTLVLLAPRLSEAEQQAAFAEVLACVRTSNNPWERAGVLVALAPILPENLIYQAYHDADIIGDAAPRAKALRALVLRWPSAERIASYTKIIEVGRTIEDAYQRTNFFIELAPDLPPQEQALIYLELLAHLSAGTVESWHAHALVRVAPDLPAELVLQAVAAARGVDDINGEKTAALLALAPYLHHEQQKAVHTEVLILIYATRDQQRRIRSICQLAAQLPPIEQLMRYKEAVDMTMGMDSPGLRAMTCVQIIPQLPPSMVTDLCAAALAGPCTAEDLIKLVPYLPIDLVLPAIAVARATSSPRWRSNALSGLAPLLPSSEQAQVYAEALVAARIVNDLGECVEGLAAVMPYLSVAQRASITSTTLTWLYSSQDEWKQTRGLTLLAPHLPLVEGPELLQEVLAATNSITNTIHRATLLATLASYVPSSLDIDISVQAINTIFAITDTQQRSSIFSSLAPQFPKTLLPQILDAFPTIQSIWARSEILAAIAPALPVALLPQVLTMAYNIPEARACIKVLQALRPRLPFPEQEGVDGETLAVVGAVGDANQCFEIIRTFAPHLLKKATHFSARAFVEASTHGDENMRYAPLTNLIPHLPDALIPEAFNVTGLLKDRQRQSYLLRLLAPRLSPALLLEAVEIARTIDRAYDRSTALSALAAHLALEEKDGVYAEALAAARAIEFVHDRAKRLLSLAPFLSEKALIFEEVRALIPSITGSLALATIWHKLALLLSLDEQVNAYAAAFSAACTMNDDDRVGLLATLANSLMARLDVSGTQDAALIWQQTIRNLSRYGRPDLLQSFVSLMPLLAQQSSPSMYEELAGAIIDVYHAWP